MKQTKTLTLILTMFLRTRFYSNMHHIMREKSGNFKFSKKSQDSRIL